MSSISKLNQPLENFLKLDKGKKEAIKRLGIDTISDLLIYKPYEYKKRRLFPALNSLKHHDEIIIKVEIKEIVYPVKKFLPVKIFGFNNSGGITITFFKMHNFLKQIFKVGAKLTLCGKIEFFDFYPQLSHPEVVFDEFMITENEPKYNLTYGITNSQIRTYVNKVINFIGNVNEWLPEKLIQKYTLCSFADAIKSIHSYKSHRISIDKAILRLKIDEAFSSQVSFKLLKNKAQNNKGRVFKINKLSQQKLLSKLDIELTEDQKKSIIEIEQDQNSNNQMLRMLQGDVGCGKTLVAVLTALNVIHSKGQVGFMAPTEVLAQQHYNFIKDNLNDFGISSCLLTSKIKQSEKNKLLDSIKKGEIDIVVGTHSLIQDKVLFNDLAYIIVDEQHKFGVNQRMDLVSKGIHPDVLIMSATPIPRTLCLTLFGDMAISKIQTMPKNRIPIKTVVNSVDKIDDVTKAISKTIAKGEKVYWICPLIENQEEAEGKIYSDVQTRFNILSAIFPGRVGILHGSLTSQDKINVVSQLKQGEINILVSTTVVEVGVDIKDATLIIIENSEKFGLAQLHQLRGRVGRGSLESLCILLYGKRTSKIAFERLKIMKESTDGFYISEKDLLLRGEGEILGERQSGDQNFIFLDLATDYEIISECNQTLNDYKINDNVITLVSIFNKQIIQKNMII